MWAHILYNIKIPDVLHRSVGILVTRVAFFRTLLGLPI